MLSFIALPSIVLISVSIWRIVLALQKLRRIGVRSTMYSIPMCIAASQINAFTRLIPSNDSPPYRDIIPYRASYSNPYYAALITDEILGLGVIMPVLVLKATSVNDSPFSVVNSGVIIIITHDAAMILVMIDCGADTAISSQLSSELNLAL